MRRIKMPDNFIRTSSVDEDHLEVDIEKRNMKLIVAITEVGVVVDLYSFDRDKRLASTWAYTTDTTGRKHEK